MAGGAVRKVPLRKAQAAPQAGGHGPGQWRRHRIGDLAVLVQVPHGSGAPPQGALEDMSVWKALQAGSLPRGDVSVFHRMVQGLAATERGREIRSAQPPELGGVLARQLLQDVGRHVGRLRQPKPLRDAGDAFAVPRRGNAGRP